MSYNNLLAPSVQKMHQRGVNNNKKKNNKKKKNTHVTTQKEKNMNYRSNTSDI